MRDHRDAASFLLGLNDVQQALGSAAWIEPSYQKEQTGVGEVLRAAAVSSGYSRYSGGTRSEGQEKPVAVGILALLFDSAEKADRTYAHVAEAAHLRTEIEGSDVAVETVTAPNGVVSYWGFVHRGPAIVVLTLDTLDPQQISMSEFRHLVLRSAERLAGQYAT